MNTTLATELDPLLRDKVRTLGALLGSTIAQQFGDERLQQIENIRKLARAARRGDLDAHNQLLDILKTLPDDALIPVVRGFNQFLNLANIAEQQHSVSWRRQDYQHDELTHMFSQLLDRLQQQGISGENLTKQVNNANIELVLTAHPTEVTRRTLIQKYDQIAKTLQRRDDLKNAHPELPLLEEKLAGLIDEIWHTDEIRHVRPSAVDEAKWGFAIIENSLWQAVPELLRELDQDLTQRGAPTLPLTSAPVRFASWMGGDRDGNPNVTSEVTRTVLYLARWMAADLYLRDLRKLNSQFSMSTAASELLPYHDEGSSEPYRNCIARLKQQLEATREWAGKCAVGEACELEPIMDENQLLDPLIACYRSLHQQGLKRLANGQLLDTIRRIACFGLTLGRLDVRQESTRHTKAIAELCDYYGWGDYQQLDENQRQELLLRELDSKRPLIPAHWQPSDDTQEVLNTMRVLADGIGDGVSCYVISMAGEPSDILAVALLLKACDVQRNLPIVPLFETLSDLEQAAARMERLWALDWYKQYCQGHQQVMIGYSDSAKDAGQLAAVWAQYSAQETLTAAAQKHHISLRLFHGRGGSVGRGGGPAHRAILAQAPGSVAGGLRVTEQGEVIRFKFGLPEIAKRNMKIYVASVLEANLLPLPHPEPRWREIMQELTAISVRSYRAIVRDEPEFVRYFRATTPEQELGQLALGSRPARRNNTGGVESLRAIPWIFSWTQIRLMLPTWLGSDEALTQMSANSLGELQDMYQRWPFFRTYIDMLEMVISKTDSNIAGYYEQRLVPQELLHFGQTLRQRLEVVHQQVLQILQQQHLLEHNIGLQHSMSVRNPYTDPLHYLQAELMQRERQQQTPNSQVEQALKVTMAGIAAGLRNTG